jgi:hypothetical protein
MRYSNPARRFSFIDLFFDLRYWRSAIALEVGGKPAQFLIWNRGKTTLLMKLGKLSQFVGQYQLSRNSSC